MDDNVAREVCFDARDEGAGSKLGKGMVPPVGGDDVMPRLGAAVIPHDNTGIKMTDKKVRQESFSGIPKPKVDDDVCAQWRDLEPARSLKVTPG